MSIRHKTYSLPMNRTLTVGKVINRRVDKAEIRLGQIGFIAPFDPSEKWWRRVNLRRVRYERFHDTVSIYGAGAQRALFLSVYHARVALPSR